MANFNCIARYFVESNERRLLVEPDLVLQKCSFGTSWTRNMISEQQHIVGRDVDVTRCPLSSWKTICKGSLLIPSRPGS